MLRPGGTLEMKPRVLIVSPDVYPTPHSGTGMRAHFQAAHLSNYLSVIVASSSGNYQVRSGVFQRVGGRLAPEINRYQAYASSMIRRTSYSYEKFACPKWALPDFKLFDCIILHYPALLRFLEKNNVGRNSLIILDTHNNEKEYYEKAASFVRWSFGRRAVLKQARHSEALICRWKGRIDATISVSDNDRVWIKNLVGDHAQHIVVPNNFFNFRPTLWSGAKTILYVGALNVKMNLQSLDWFRQLIWPQVHVSDREIKFIVAGRNPSAALVRGLLADDITVVENPETLAPVFEEAALSIVPGWSGSGAKIKVCEALASGVPVLTTTGGAVGQPQEIIGCCIVRDTPSEWICAILEYFSRPERTNQAWLSKVEIALGRSYFGGSAAELAILLKEACAARRVEPHL
jgi:glycosyltransferase involved in cell wall biosynthesis